jgi:hypothetical protein
MSNIVAARGVAFLQDWKTRGRKISPCALEMTDSDLDQRERSFPVLVEAAMFLENN